MAFHALFEPPHDYHHRHHGHHGKSLSHEELQAILFDTPSSEKAEEWSNYYTAGPHLAGQNYSQVFQLLSTWELNSDLYLRLNGLETNGANGASRPRSFLMMSTSTIQSITAFQS